MASEYILCELSVPVGLQVTKPSKALTKKLQLPRRALVLTYFPLQEQQFGMFNSVTVRPFSRNGVPAKGSAKLKSAVAEALQVLESGAAFV